MLPRFFLILIILIAPILYGEISLNQYETIVVQMRNIPKSELHLHLGGAWPIEYLRTISDPQDCENLCLMIDQLQEGKLDYHSAFKVFGLIGKIVNTDEKVENGVVALCHDLISDNVVYAELRTGLKDLGSGLEGHLKSVLKGMKRGTSETAITAGLILSVRRDTDALTAEKTIELALKYRDQGIIGIDISGDSTIGDGKALFAALAKAKAHRFPITLHIGESPEEQGEQQMLELTTIQPERIGHAVHLCEEAKKWVQDNNILVELCLTSALKTGMIKEASEHPALNLLLEGHPVAICTDDPLIFKTTLSEEYALVSMLTGLTAAALQNCGKR